MLESGQMLDHFKIIKKLGSGGMGVVYLAEDTKLQRKVALKTLLAEFFEDSERKERFQREARTAAQITHQNVMGIYDINTAPDPKTGHDINYIVMEYIEGQLLKDYLNSKTLEITETIRLAEHIASGLAAAHKMKVIHRDIKATNIIIDPSNNPKILDFGLAKPAESHQKRGDKDTTDSISQELTTAGKIIGTVSYMSPEQVKGETIDTRSDIFSYGILLYRMISGKLPFEGNTHVSIMAKILETHHTSLQIEHEGIPAELERIINKCLQKSPNDRYQDTRDLVVDLRNLRKQYNSDISSQVSSISATQIGNEKANSFKISSKSAIFIISILIVIVSLYFTIFNNDSSPGGGLVFASENGLAILSFENKTGSEEFEWLQTGLPEILQTDLAQINAVTIISRNRVLDYFGQSDDNSTDRRSHQDFLKAANELGATHALSGAFYKLGDNIRIDARLEELETGKIVLTEKVMGADPFILVDSLTDKIAISLNFSDKKSTTTNVSQLTSSSPEAYKTYLAAMEKFQLQLYDDAIKGFKEAIDIDSTFALPYMRIGMSHVFNNHPQSGTSWFAKAKQFEDKLPVRDRSVLDVYADIWMDSNFDDAFTKMEALVKNYPDDKEARTLYALMIHVFAQDTAGAFAQLDTVLQISPRYLLVLSQYSSMHLQYENYDKAIEYAELARKYHPDSPTSYSFLAIIYSRQKELDKAIEIYQHQLELFPRESESLVNLYRVFIFKRQFDEAEKYIEKVKEHHSDDPFKMTDYYNRKANLAFWKGRLKTALEYRFKALEQIVLAGDSSLISSQYSVIGSNYKTLGMIDSSLFYREKAYAWAVGLQGIDYPLSMVTIDPALADSARPMFSKGIEKLRSNFPTDLWPIIDAIEDAFEAIIAGDTAALIQAYINSDLSLNQNNEANRRNYAYLYSLTGGYEEAIEILSQYYSDSGLTSSGFTYLRCLYHLGIAYEGIGAYDKAIEVYGDLLKYWSNADIQIEEITDTKKRLAGLTG